MCRRAVQCISQSKVQVVDRMNNRQANRSIQADETEVPVLGTNETFVCNSDWSNNGQTPSTCVCAVPNTCPNWKQRPKWSKKLKATMPRNVPWNVLSVIPKFQDGPSWLRLSLEKRYLGCTLPIHFSPFCIQISPIALVTTVSSR